MGIRIVPTASETVPSRVFKHLLPRETTSVAVRFHPAVLIKPVTLVLGGLALAGLLSATVTTKNGYALLAIWVAWAVLVIWFLVRVYEWLDNYFVVTNKRLILATGIVTRNVNMMPLDKVTDMSFRRTPVGQLLGYGEFIVESAGQNQAFERVGHIPYPEQLYLEVCAVLFPDKEDDDDTQKVKTLNVENLSAQGLYAQDFSAQDINARDINAQDINAEDIKAQNINAPVVNTQNINTKNINRKW